MRGDRRHRVPPARSRQFDVMSFTRGTSRRVCWVRTSYQDIRCRQEDEDVGNHHPIGIAIQKLDERRAYLVFLHRNLSALRQDVKQIQWHQWFAANGLEAPALHPMTFEPFSQSPPPPSSRPCPASL